MRFRKRCSRPVSYTHLDVYKRQALLDNAGIDSLLGTVLVLLVMGAVLIPSGVYVFARAERRAKRLGLLKRNG